MVGTIRINRPLELAKDLVKLGRYRLFLAILLASCATSSPWQISHIQGSKKEFDSARLIYPVHDRVNGIAVEMVYTQNSLRTYLVVHSQTIPPYKGNVEQALVCLKTPHKTIHEVAPRHQGGQRVSLPPHLQEILIETLLSGSPVTLELLGYSAKLSPQEFATQYQNLQKTPLNIPFQLTFKL